MQVATGWRICLWLGLVFSSYCTNSRYCLDVSNVANNEGVRNVRNVKTAGSKLPLPFVGTISHGEPGVCLREPRSDSMSSCRWILHEDAKHFKMLHHLFIRFHNQHSSTFRTLYLLILSIFVRAFTHTETAEEAVLQHSESWQTCRSKNAISVGCV